MGYDPIPYLVWDQPGREVQLVHQPFLSEEIRRSERRSQGSDSQVPLRAQSMVDDPSVRNVVHVVLRQADLVEAHAGRRVHHGRLRAKGKMLDRRDSGTGVTPLLVLERGDLAVLVHRRADIGKMG